MITNQNKIEKVVSYTPSKLQNPKLLRQKSQVYRFCLFPLVRLSFFSSSYVKRYQKKSKAGNSSNNNNNNNYF